MSGADERDGLLRDAALGEQVKSFLVSDVGRYILSKSFEEAETALVDLVGCSPTDAEGIRRLQNIVQRSDSLKSWLEGAVTDGLNALNILEERE